MGKWFKQFFNGLIKENPTFVLMLGMCPTLAVTTSASNGLGMGLTTTAVLALSNLFISLIRKIIPDKVRIPAFIVVVAAFVTIVQMLLQAYLPELNESLGLYIPLIVVNCIILGRAEAFAYKNGPVISLFDGLGMGLGFTFGLTCIASVREIIGAGTIFGAHIMPASYEPMAIFTLAPGAFFVLALLTALQNVFKAPSATNTPNAKVACGGNCAACMDGGCVANREEIARVNGIKEAEAVAAKAEAARKAAEAKKAAEAAKAAAEAAKAEETPATENKEGEA
ncbi:MAG: electron transport complex subunit E [Lachnospiraceae bacterium]|nr:electron transport complex subunit E [Lachnospiraceae bacterium]